MEEESLSPSSAGTLALLRGGFKDEPPGLPSQSRMETERHWGVWLAEDRGDAEEMRGLLMCLTMVNYSRGMFLLLHPLDSCVLHLEF